MDDLLEEGLRHLRSGIQQEADFSSSGAGLKHLQALELKLLTLFQHYTGTAKIAFEKYLIVLEIKAGIVLLSMSRCQLVYGRTEVR